MKRIVLISLCAIIILMMFGCSNDGSIKDDEREQLNTYLALMIPFNDKVALGGAACYCSCELIPPTTFLGVKFETFETGGGTVYSPLEKVSEQKYESILKELEEIYGQPSYKIGYMVEWVSMDGSFSLTVTFDPDIHNQMAMRCDID